MTTRRSFGYESLLPSFERYRMPPWIRAFLFLSVLTFIAGVFVLVYFAFHMTTFRVTFKFSLIYEIEEEEEFKVLMNTYCAIAKVCISLLRT